MRFHETNKMLWNFSGITIDFCEIAKSFFDFRFRFRYLQKMTAKFWCLLNWFKFQSFALFDGESYKSQYCSYLVCVCGRGGGRKGEGGTALMMPKMIVSMKIITVDGASPAFAPRWQEKKWLRQSNDNLFWIVHSSQGSLTEGEGSVLLTLNVQTSLHQLLLQLKISFTYVTKQPTLMKRSTVLSLPL
jgi:hypothetical protein